MSELNTIFDTSEMLKNVYKERGGMEGGREERGRN